MRSDTIRIHGKNDGEDGKRYILAAWMAKKMDTHVDKCFKSLVSLEDKGLININYDANE